MSQPRNPEMEAIYARRWPIFAASVIGAFLSYVDATIVNVSVPELQRAFDADIVTVAWVVNAYNIAFAVPLVAMGRLADQFGRRRMMLIGLAAFGLGSLACAVAPTIEWLIAARVAQGFGASVLVPLSLATTVMVFPPEERGRGVTIQGAIGNFGAVVGPVAGGLLLQYASWPWIFWINVPICVVAFFVVRRVVPETYDLAAGRSVDVRGMALLAGAMLALSVAVVEGNEWGWSSAPVLGLFAAAALLSVAFAISQRRAKSPMLPRALARESRFIGAAGTFLLFSLGMLGTFFLLIVGMVELWGYSPLKAALATLAVPAGAVLVTPFVARFSDRLPPRTLIVPATIATAAGILLLSDFPAEANYLKVLPTMLLLGAGAGTMFPVGFAGGMDTLPGQEFGLGAGLLNVSRALGVALGVAIVAAVFTAALEPRLDDARAAIREQAAAAGYPPERTEALLERLRFDPQRGASQQVENPGPVEREVRRRAAEAASDSIGIAFTVAALIVLLSTLTILPLNRRLASDAAPAEAVATA
jgi:EmrB/QacA subfamily drug resistance transporter